MKYIFRKRTLSLLFFILFISCGHTLAQFNDYKAKFGLQLNGLLPDTEFDKDLRPSDAEFKFSYLGRAYIRFELITNVVETEVAGGFGRLSGVDTKNKNWWSYIIPLDLRLIISPFDMDVWNPYVYGGGGVTYFKNDKKPSIPSPQPVNESGWTGIIPVGAGVEIGLSDALILDISGGYTFTFSDEINGYSNKDLPTLDGSNDGYYNLGVGLTLVSGSGSSDNDKDGLTKREEKELGTDPDNPDSDEDGLKDGAEVKKYFTNPLNPDTDGDGLNDGDEVNKYGTSPVKADTDLDDLNDGKEVLTYKTDPLNSDSDNDKLLDGEEVNKYKTNPLKADSDGDLLKDGEEVDLGTNPLKPDSDFDGLNDGEEVNVYKTDPLNKDTDGGSVDDFTEVKRGTNPLDPEDDIIKINVPIVLEGITFETGKANITPESEKVLQGALKTLKTYPDIVVEISGHTDDVGSKASNLKLSQRRADAVRFWLIQNGIDPDRLIAKGYGEDFPIVPNNSAENRRMNRRIEFKRIK
ncbi:OmpA family protein [bacterium BMS3Abin03]|jgi:outer membrane protein OmpA-like peptidoglycan-associated protein|nr:OmpA family protein [bacterium BMS3Abin03]